LHFKFFQKEKKKGSFRKRRKKKMSVEWTELPPEIIETISKKLTIYADYLRFRCISRTFLSSIPKNPLHLPPQLPCLILSHQSFFDLSTHKTHLFNHPLPSHNRTRFCGSSHGFLVILDQTPQIRIFNPITHVTLFLPPINTFPNVISFDYSNIGREYFVRNPSGDLVYFNLKQMCNSFIRKIVLSSSPSQNDEFIAFAIVASNDTNNLAFCKKGYDSWILLSEEIYHFWEDVVYHNGLFYAVSKGGTIAVCDIEVPRVSIIHTTASVEFNGDIFYTVFSGEEMLLVTRILEQDFSDAGDMFVYRTVGFEVFKMDWNVMTWNKIETLGDKALFVGGNSSVCFSANDFVGCCADCIYFTDDYSESNHDDVRGKHDFGIFRLRDWTVDPLLPSYSRLGCPLPVWISPNPY
jgi:hypothetical protein